MYNFDVVAVDTDSLFFKKKDQSPFTPEEQKQVMDALNSIMPEKIRWDTNGYFKKLVTLKTKNYIMYDGEKIKYKGSALKDSKKEKAVKEFLQEIVKAIIDERNDHQAIYHKYLKEAMNITDIKRWCSKRTITSKIFSSERANETKVKDAIVGSELVEGDKAYLLFDENDNLVLAENFKGSYNKNRMVKKLFDASKVFGAVLPKDTFVNYSLKKNQKELTEIIS